MAKLRKSVIAITVAVAIAIALFAFLYLHNAPPTRSKGDLVLWLPFDGDFQDHSPYLHRTTVSGNPNFTDGVCGKAVYLDGIDDYISVADAPELSIVNNPKGMTVTFWMSPATLHYPTANEYGYIRFLGKGMLNEFEWCGYEWCFVIYNNDSARPNRISFYVNNRTGGLGIGAYVQEPIQVNEWIFIAGVIQNGVLKIYKNGVFKGVSYNYTEPNPIGIIIPEDGNAPLNIGTRDGSEYFMGRIDDVRVYSRALTEDEIMNLYNSTKSCLH